MTTKRGRDIYEATEKEYDTSGYRKAVCNQWIADHQSADFHSPTVFEPKKHGPKHQAQYSQAYKLQSQKFTDMNKQPTAKGSQRRESSSRARRNNNDNDDFVELLSGFENRLDNVKNDAAKANHSQPPTMSQKNEKSYEKPYRSSQTHDKPYRKSQEKPYSQSKARSIDKRRPEKQTNIFDDLDFDEFNFDFPDDENVELSKRSADRGRKQKKDFLPVFGDEHGTSRAIKRKKEDDLDFAIGFGDERGNSRVKKQKRDENDDFAVDFGDYCERRPVDKRNPRCDDDKHVSKVGHSDRNMKPVDDTFGQDSPKYVIFKKIKEKSYTEMLEASPMLKNEKNERSKQVEKGRSKEPSFKKLSDRYALERYERDNRKKKHNEHDNRLISNEVEPFGMPIVKANRGMQALKGFTRRTSTVPIINIKCNNLIVHTD